LVFTLIVSCKKDEIDSAPKHIASAEISLSKKLQKARKDIKNNQNLLSYSETVFDENKRQFILNAKSGNYSSTEDEEDGRTLSPEEEMFFESYFNDINHSGLTKLEVTNYYINILPPLDLANESEIYCLETLSLLKNLYTEIGDEPATPWDDRWDNCMRAKAKAIEDGNWVDKVIFLSNPGVAVLQ
jgi:hypothetical protein